MRPHDYQVYLKHIRDFVLKATRISRDKTRADLDNDEIFRYALLHLITIMGEAAGRITPEFRRIHAEIPWGDIIGTRNRIIHGYDTVSLDILWETLVTDLPNLLDHLSAILSEDA